jgi:hypothetical protein
MNSDFILNIAEVLDKTAAYLEELDSATSQQQKVAQHKEANSLASKLKTITGEQISDDMVEKLSSADPAIKSLLAKIACVDGAPDSLGGPETNNNIKVAGVDSRGMGLAEDNFLAWLST